MSRTFWNWASWYSVIIYRRCCELPIILISQSQHIPNLESKIWALSSIFNPPCVCFFPLLMQKSRAIYNFSGEDPQREDIQTRPPGPAREQQDERERQWKWWWRRAGGGRGGALRPWGTWGARAALRPQALALRRLPDRRPCLMSLQVFPSMESSVGTAHLHASRVSSFLGSGPLFLWPLSLVTFQTRRSRVTSVIRSAKKKRTFTR